MRFPVFASQSLTGDTGDRTSLRTGGPSLPRAKRSRRFLWRLGAICLALSGLLYAFALLSEAGSSRLQFKSPVAAPLPAWIEIPRPQEIFRLEAPELAGEAKFYDARRHRTGGGRQDILEFGGSNGNAPMLHLVIYRPGKEPAPDQPFFVDLARRAAETGRAITRAAQPTPMATRFGAFEVAGLSLARNGAPATECLGFRFANAAPDLRITGFACGGGPALVSPLLSKSALACLIGGIGLAPTAEDTGLVRFFAAHDAIRTSCPNPAPLVPARLSKAAEAAPIKRQGKSR